MHSSTSCQTAEGWDGAKAGVGSAFPALAVGVGAALVSQRLLAPIRTLTEGVKGVAGGDLTRQVPVRGTDELATLAREFNAMARALRDREGVLAARSQELLRLTGFAENIIRSVRVGIPVSEAMRHVARQSQPPTAPEFERIASDLAIGTRLDLSLKAMAKRAGISKGASRDTIPIVHSPTMDTRRRARWALDSPTSR